MLVGIQGGGENRGEKLNDEGRKRNLGSSREMFPGSYIHRGKILFFFFFRNYFINF